MPNSEQPSDPVTTDATDLVLYADARRAMAELHRVDEVKGIRDKAKAVQVYAQQAKDRTLIHHATEIRMRAEIRAGELLAQMEKNKGTRGQLRGDLPLGGCAPKPPTSDPTPTLRELGINKWQSSRWQKLAALSADEQEATIAAAKRKAEAVPDGAARAGEKAKRRAERERDLASRVEALPLRRYPVIVADPEWRFEPWSRETGMDRAADNHYPTSALEVIAARDVPSIAADDCVLFLWATIPMLPHALAVMAAWGFAYKSRAKDKLGTGYWNRERHELLLIGTRGDVPCPAPGTQWPSLIEAPRQAHSAKPECFLEMIEAYFPNVPKIELNRRGPARSGWDAWGNEATAADAAQ
jgi:N6-adenosine-specific RNA methylase IME4